MRIVERDGRAAVTFARVAQEVGLSSASVVQRFGAKRDLLLAATVRGWRSLLDAFPEARRSHASPLDALLAVLVAMTSTVRTPEAMANSIAFLHIDLSDPEFHRHAVTGAAEMRDRIERLLAEAVAAGELAPTDTRRLATGVQNTYNGALVTWAIYREGSIGEWVRAQVEFLLDGFRA
jgi:AcrR family transcriptional regulator